eukprot:4776085-Prymnesium_polylepis.2
MGHPEDSEPRRVRNFRIAARARALQPQAMLKRRELIFRVISWCICTQPSQRLERCVLVTAPQEQPAWRLGQALCGKALHDGERY